MIPYIVNRDVSETAKVSLTERRKKKVGINGGWGWTWLRGVMREQRGVSNGRSD